jgi:hypothetical protein
MIASRTWIAIPLLLLAWHPPAQAQTSPGEMLQRGLYEEEVRGDLETAIRFYRRVLASTSPSRRIAALALQRIGRCQEKLGAPEARVTYRRVISEYGEQVDIVARAEARLDLLENLASNPARVGFPHPLASDPGWGGGADPWDIVDGVRIYSRWDRGLAFTGGIRGYEEPCGWRQATITFAEPRTFNRVVVWHHSDGNVPNTYRIEYLPGDRWAEVFRTVDGDGRSYRTYRSTVWSPWWESWSTPTENRFPPVTGSAVRFAFDNCDISHGWIWAFEVFLDPPLVTEVTVDAVPGDPSNALSHDEEVMPVAILSTPDFDATLVEIATVSLTAEQGSFRTLDHALEDVDADGDLDLLLRFRLAQVDIGCGPTRLELSGATKGGAPIHGVDTVFATGCR